MKGDFSRFNFEARKDSAKKHYARVLKQQGRVDLDADWNEQVAILLHRLETMAADIIGPFGGPRDACGFEITPDKWDFKISKGRYYVGGLLCENDDENTTFLKQPFAPAEMKFTPGITYVVYLQAWEHYVNSIEDPGILEKALGGTDTAGRSKVVWRVMANEFNPYNDVESVKQAIREAETANPSADKKRLFTCKMLRDHWHDVRNVFHPPNRGMLSVRAEQHDPRSSSPCITSPAARFRGTENQLYRVEVHSGGPASASPVKRSSKGVIDPNLASFRWSRENGSVVFPVISGSGNTVTLAGMRGDATLDLKVGDYVELVDDASARQPSTPLMQVENVKQSERQVVLKPAPPIIPEHQHSYLRRWDQKAGTENKGGLVLREGEAIIVEDRWLDLEDGIQVRFEPAKNGVHQYRPGDYWCIPARTVDDGKIDWPSPVEPHGIDYRFAPLAVLNCTEKGFDHQNMGNCVIRFDPQGHFGKV
ncbi:MAG TPA: DUF6519 domain-containing protein [Candidatus Angelobacter sp.]